jgi:hypothetical protein
MFSTPISRAAAIVLGVATFIAAPAAAQALPLDLKARATADGVRYELTNKSQYPTQYLYFRAPDGAKYDSTDDATCESQNNMVFCQQAVAPGATKTLTAKGQGLGAGTEHEACASAAEPGVQGCVKTIVEAMQQQPPPPPPPTQSSTAPATNVAEPPPVPNAVNVDLRELLSCKCEKIVVGAIRSHTKKGRVNGVRYATIHDDRGRHEAGFGLRTQLICTPGIFADACNGTVTIKAPKGIKLAAKTKTITCKGQCGENPTQDTFVKMSGKAATKRDDPLTFEITTTCADGTKETTDLTFVFDRHGNVDWRKSDLGEGLADPPKPEKKAAKKAPAPKKGK